MAPHKAFSGREHTEKKKKRRKDGNLSVSKSEWIIRVRVFPIPSFGWCNQDEQTMRTPCCHSFVAFILKFFNFLLTFIGISIIVYSAYMLNQLNNHSFNPPPLPPPSAPSPDYPETLFSNFEAVRILDQITPLNLPSDDGMIKLHAPAPWYFKICICFDCFQLCL